MGSALKDLVARVVTTVHRGVLELTGARVGGDLAGMPVVVLTTTGRRSGEPRKTVLTSPLQEGDRVVLVASYGGDDRHPQWYRNLEVDPDVEMSMRGRGRQKMRARVATAEEKARLWPQVTAAYRGYAGYQQRTDRDIPIVILEPR